MQIIDGKKQVFIKHENNFEPVSVITVNSNKHQIQILSGIEEGQEIVTEGAFYLKSKIITGTLDDHAGHGH